MNCLETERLIRYAYRLIDGPAAEEVRAHLEDCPRCREIVELYGRLDTVLHEWTVAEPTPGFDARMRQRVETKEAEGGAWGFWSQHWTSGLALASLAVLIVAGVAWFTHGRRAVSASKPVATSQLKPAGGDKAPAPVATGYSPDATTHAVAGSAQDVRGLALAHTAMNDDKDAQALEDYDLAANFDLLSELPKAETQVAD